MSYKNLEIWSMARELADEVHRMTLTRKPKFEMYDTGSLADDGLFADLHARLNDLGGKLNRFSTSVEAGRRT